MLTVEELNAKMDQCIRLIDGIFPEKFVRTALFVYQLDEKNDDIVTSAISMLDFEQLRLLLIEFIKSEEDDFDITEAPVSKNTLN